MDALEDVPVGESETGSNEFGRFLPDVQLISTLRAGPMGIRFETLTPRWMSPRRARRLAEDLIRCAEWAEARGCHPDFCDPGRP